MTDARGVREFTDLVAQELTQGLELFWDTAAAILDQGPVGLKLPGPDGFALENHFFSALFLYSYIRGGIPRERRIFYAAANQCLRGMVTGCDNILDNEYKMTLDTDLPKAAHRFRSILDIMVCDRVLTALMFKGVGAGFFELDQVLTADIVSLHALLRSGAQEASEEQGVETPLAPEVLLADIHSIKTGILFQAPWALPEALEGKGPDAIKQGLFLIGLGCQVLDDMVDLALDVTARRHNYVHSLICRDKEAAAMLEKALALGQVVSGDRVFLEWFPMVLDQARTKALDLLEQGCSLLFAPEHRAMTPFAIRFLMNRIAPDLFRKGEL